jgi:CheY-like chemotaxis protein
MTEMAKSSSISPPRGSEPAAPGRDVSHRPCWDSLDVKVANRMLTGKELLSALFHLLRGEPVDKAELLDPASGRAIKDPLNVNWNKFPLAEAGEAAAALPISPRTSSGTVLIVDDDDDLRNVMAEVLTEEGFSACTASNGQEALEAISRVRPGLILLDWMMPVMDGQETLESLRANEELAKIPVVIVSVSDRSKAVRGIAPLLKKPFKREVLLKMAHEACAAP